MNKRQIEDKVFVGGTSMCFTLALISWKQKIIQVCKGNEEIIKLYKIHTIQQHEEVETNAKRI